jgi:hypothetical protein
MLGELASKLAQPQGCASTCVGTPLSAPSTRSRITYADSFRARLKREAQP